jgi:hypothetical protein
MGPMWATLVPFIIASALMPVELVITLALLGTPGRVRTAGAAVSGMVLVRLLQGLIFGMILHWGKREETKGGHGWLVSTVILVVALVLLVGAIRELLGGNDSDDPPPKWMAALSSMTPGKAFLLGAAVILISVKLWVFTFAALGAIGDAGMPRSANFATYIAFVLLGVSTHLAIITVAAFFPDRSRAFLDRSLRWLQDHNRVIMIGLGLLFGGWFLVKGLHGFGIV